MRQLDKQAQEILLKCARSAIADVIAPAAAADVAADPVPPAVKEHRGCFVTLKLRGRLRGCIGNIEPVMPLMDAVAHNARNAAFRDLRFSPVTPDEIEKIVIEVSVLTVPHRIEFADAEDLKRKLIPGKHGVIIRRAGSAAVFLPQVWQQLPDTELFLKHLCMKCGLPGNAWKETGSEVSVFEAEYFSETDREKPSVL